MEPVNFGQSFTEYTPSSLRSVGPPEGPSNCCAGVGEPVQFSTGQKCSVFTGRRHPCTV